MIRDAEPTANQHALAFYQKAGFIADHEVQTRFGSSTAPLLTLEPRVWYNPELRSTLFLVPGLIAYIAMLTAVVSTALSVVREKEAGTMEQIRMSPIGASAYVVGKTVPYFVISLVSSLGVEIGGRTVPAEPFEMIRANVVTTAGRPDGPTAGPAWSVDAQERLTRVPSFVRGMVKKIYADYAKERGITEITPAIMDTARAELGLEGM